MENTTPQYHLFIATPAYSGTVHAQYAIALSDTSTFLTMNGVKVTTRMPTSGSLLVAERNRLLEMFWQSDATHMLCIDGDLGWPADKVLSLLKSGEDFVGGVYPARDGTYFNYRPKLNPNGSVVVRELNGVPYLGAEYVPAGFILLSRKAVGMMRDAFPETFYSPKDERNPSESTYCLFNTEVWNGEFWGEDYVFCRRARQAGLDIWVDPDIMFDHAGRQGKLVYVLTDKSPEEQAALVAAQQEANSSLKEAA